MEQFLDQTIPRLIGNISALTYAMAKSNLTSAAALLFVYGLGRGVPLLLAGTFTSVVRTLPKMERWTTLAQKAAGVVLVGVGVYFVWVA